MCLIDDDTLVYLTAGPTSESFDFDLGYLIENLHTKSYKL